MASTAARIDMAERIQIKRSDVPGRVPLSADLVVGELAINTADGKLFTKLADNTVVEIPLKGPIRNVTGITEENYIIDSMFEISALAVENIWMPTGNASSVVPTAFFSSVADTTNGDMIGASHQISVFNHHVTRGGGSQATQYGQEFRVRQEDGSHLGEYIATKHVVEPTSSNSGTMGGYTLEQFDDMRGSVTHVESFSRQFLDPRILTVHAGGEIRLPEVITAPRTLGDLDSGKDFYVVSATDVSITIAPTIDGFRARVFQVAAGRAVFGFGAMSVAEPDGLRSTQGQGHQATLGAAPSAGIAFLGLSKPPVFLHAGIRGGRTFGAHGRTLLVPLVNNALTANVLYPVPIVVPRAINLATLGIRVTAALSGHNIRLALFANNGLGLPGARLYQSANISTATVGDKQVSGLNLALPPGMYFLCVICSGAAQVPWAANIGLDSVFGRPSSTATEILPVYSSTVTTIPADLTSVAPTAYINSSNAAPDVYWRA